MALKREYSGKINRFKEVIPKRMYQGLERVSFEGFITDEKLTFDEAHAHERSAYAEGTKWGKKWEYGWFFTTVVIPESCRGKRVVFKAELGECVAFVNGKVYGSIDREHSSITLAESAKGGEQFEIAMEVYAGHAGHDGIAQTTNTVPLATAVIPEDNMKEFPEDVEQKTVKNGEIGIFQEDVFQFWMDFNTLFELRGHFEASSWRQANIDKCLEKVCDLLDVEAPLAVFFDKVKEARAIMASSLACKNGTSAPTMYAVGNSHLDLEWLWPVEETMRKGARTLGNQIRLLEEYDDYIYIHSQPWILASVKQDYPEFYEEIKEWVKKGRIIVEGGMWVESDTNMPSGESLIRQFIVGKRFISEEFGKESEILWLPDVFGCSAVLPQIMKGCGIKYFLNAKVGWVYNGGAPFPYHNFIWRGLDGSEVLTHVTGDYASGASPNSIRDKWVHLNAERMDIPAKLFLYGHGDGGGGATRIHQEYIKRERDLEGLPKVKMAPPKEYFEFVENDCEVNNKYQGELYFAAHRGTYTSQAKTKKLNRQSERALREAEMWACLLRKDSSASEKLEPLWKEVLFNHFHDVIPGSSITRVYERAEKSYAKVISEADAMTEKILSSVLSDKQDVFTVFNSLSWDRNELVELPNGYQKAYDMDGNAVETQVIDGKTLALVSVPSCGMASYQLCTEDSKIQETVKDELYLENDLIRAEFNDQGELVRVTDKEKGVEFLAGASNQFHVYQDAPTMFDAWDIDSFYEKLEVTDMTACEVKVEQRGNLLSSIVVSKKVNDSEIKQRISLRKDSKRIDFETEVDWNETHKLLKVDFNTNIHTDELISEIQFGHIKRPNHRSRQHDADRFEVCQHKWSALAEANRGFAVLNDCKYGIGAFEGEISLTLLKSAAAPALHADKGMHQFTYSVMPFTGTFFDSNVVRAGYELNYPVTTRVGAGANASFLRLSEKNVIAETMKFAEDGSGDLIIRLYECQNAYTTCKLEFGFDIQDVYITDMLENNKEQVEVEANGVTLRLKAFEILTLRVRI